MRALALVLGLVSAEALIVEEAQTATIHVPGDYSTVYQALDAASSGDIVEVAPGTYDQLDTRPAWFGDQVSAVGFLKDGVTLKSSGGAGVTTLRLDSNSARPVILFGGAGDFQVEGFTFTGSLADLIGIAIQSPDDQTGSLHLLDCVIGDYGMGNTLTHEVAIDAYSADVHVQNCTIQNIDSPNAVAVYGIGGDHLFEDSLFE
ncbi:MAG TPA: hypothetical protein VFR10_02485, partial [bacterium]|nr:hypothetical protein [bacterium]